MKLITSRKNKVKSPLNDLKQTGWSYTNKELAINDAHNINMYFQEKGSNQRVRIIE